MYNMFLSFYICSPQSLVSQMQFKNQKYISDLSVRNILWRWSYQSLENQELLWLLRVTFKIGTFRIRPVLCMSPFSFSGSLNPNQGCFAFFLLYLCSVNFFCKHDSLYKIEQFNYLHFHEEKKLRIWLNHCLAKLVSRKT